MLNSPGFSLPQIGARREEIRFIPTRKHGQDTAIVAEGHVLAE